MFFLVLVEPFCSVLLRQQQLRSSRQALATSWLSLVQKFQIFSAFYSEGNVKVHWFSRCFDNARSAEASRKTRIQPKLSTWRSETFHGLHNLIIWDKNWRLKPNFQICYLRWTWKGKLSKKYHIRLFKHLKYLLCAFTQWVIFSSTPCKVLVFGHLICVIKNNYHS